MIPGSALPLLLATTGGGINPRSYFDVKLYTGNGSTQTISGLGFESDLIWIKKRSGAEGHLLSDTVRGIEKGLYSNQTDAEDTYLQFGKVSAVSSTGFTVAATTNTPLIVNESGQTYAAWTWDAGSSTVTNTDGSISSQVRANPSAGFSIVTYTGNGSSASVGHGLNAVPGLMIVKRRDSAVDWVVYHSTQGKDKYLLLNNTSAAATEPSYWGASGPSSTVINYGSGYGGVNTTSGLYVAYCFTPVAGYSSFGIYTGNGSAGGPIISGLGFTPYFVMIKASSTTGDWWMYDGARSTTNPRINKLKANSSNAEDTAGEDVDFQSDGFQIKTADIGLNQNAATYIYAAFA